MYSLEPETLKFLDMINTYGFRMLMFYLWGSFAIILTTTFIIYKLFTKEKIYENN